MKVYKYRVLIGTNYLQLSHNHKILSAGVQENSLVVWAQIDPEQTFDTPVEIVVVGTGWDFDPTDLQFVGTTQIDGFVWHTFVKVRK